MQTINITVDCPFDNGPQTVPCVGQIDFVQVCSIAYLNKCKSCIQVNLVLSSNGMHIFV